MIRPAPRRSRIALPVDHARLVGDFVMELAPGGNGTQLATGLVGVCVTLLFWMADETNTTPEAILQRLGALAAEAGTAGDG